ncbi:protein of unknown function [Modestobacter italicus]|uniref:Uncharacterized protein n=1 Tax=Modestobacter italicus (strain DSM 44449 / CECT 9708 / BC 501) TaxID=2732864 RepID=I4F0L0_MODI5|nr:protein of unknown function [Modestobacter marinus]
MQTIPGPLPERRRQRADEFVEVEVKRPEAARTYDLDRSGQARRLALSGRIESLLSAGVAGSTVPSAPVLTGGQCSRGRLEVRLRPAVRCWSRRHRRRRCRCLRAPRRRPDSLRSGASILI